MVLEKLIPSGESGNLLITGVPMRGAGASFAFSQSMYESLEEGAPVFAILDMADEKACTGLINRAKAAGFRTVDLNSAKPEAPRFNLLSAGRSSEEKARLLWSLLERRGDTPETAENAVRYLRLAIRVLEERGEEATPERALRLKVEDVASGTELLFADEWDKEDALIYLSGDAAYKAWGSLSDRSSVLREKGFLRLLSGPEDAGKLISGRTLTLVSATPAERELLPGFDRLTNAMAQVFLKFGERKNAAGESWHFFIREAQNLRPGTLRAVLSAGSAAPAAAPAVCIFQESVVDLFSAHSESAVDYFDNIAVFRTNDGTYWSRFFGTTPRVETNVTYGTKKSIFHLPTGGGGTVPRGRYREEGYSAHMEEKPVYEARKFKFLADNEFIAYDRRTRRNGIKKLL